MNKLIPNEKSNMFRMRNLILTICTLLCAINLMAQDVTLKGIVTSASEKEPMPGVSVVQTGTSNGTITNLNGEFSLKVPANGSLTISYLGYATQTIEVKGQTSLAIEMVEDLIGLDEVVVVGFASQKKVNLTGAITAVGKEVFENRPVANIGQALQGVVPNLNVSISNGAPNTVPSFNIRGGTSIVLSDGNWVVERGAPLILVDGVEYSATMLNQMNPNDIENMSVIKDASAAAIYGTKATYGVMLIQTKSGKFGQKGKISYSYDLSYDRPSAVPDILDAYSLQTAAMNRTRWTTPGGTVSSAEELKLENIRKYMDDPRPENAWYTSGASIVWVANMNPYDLVLRSSSPMHKHNMNIQGGSDRISYYLSLGYQTEEGLYKINNDEYKRYNGMLRVNAQVNKRFSIEGRLNYNRTTYEAPYLVGGKGTLWSAMRTQAPKNINMPLMTGPDDPIPNAYTDNIISWLMYGARTRSLSTTTAMSVSPVFTIIPDILKAKADLSFTPQASESNRRSPKHEYVNINWNGLVSEQAEAQEHRGQLSRSATDTYLVNAYMDYNQTFAKKHAVSAIVGFSQEYVNYGALTVDLRGLFSPDIQKPSAAEDVTLHTQSVGAQRRTARGVFGRINYIFNDRYLLEVNNRYDGSSRFTKNERFVSFPSFSAGWIISQERFMEFSKMWLTHLKIKGSWGKLGSQPGSYYPYQEILSSGTASYFIDGKWASYVGAPGLVSPTLTWQKATTANFGFEANFLKNRLKSDFNTYRRKVTDILLQGEIPYPAVLGASAPLINSGQLDSYGWELSLSWQDRLSCGFSYKVGLVLSDEQTEVIKFSGNPDKLLSTLYDGMVTGNIWGYETGGIVQESDLEPDPRTAGAWLFHGPKSPNATYWPGYVWYRDINGDGVINSGANRLEEHGDLKLLGNSSARYRYGITIDAGYKGFDLNLFFQGIGKRDLWIGNSAFWGGGADNAGSRFMYENSWTPERTDAKYPMYGGGAPSTQSAYMFNGAYMRLKQAVLNYTVPQALTSKAGIERLRFSISGFNLFDITQIPDIFDPDQVSDAYPQRRTFSFGTQITF